MYFYTGLNEWFILGETFSLLGKGAGKLSK
jgi:hypothetical protein